MTETSKTIVSRFYSEVFNEGNLAMVDELVAPEYSERNLITGQRRYGAGRLKQRVLAYRTAFPDLEVSVEELIAEGESIAVHIAGRGTHLGVFKTVTPTGQLLTINPTGRTVTIVKMDVYRIADGRIVEYSSYPPYLSYEPLQAPAGGPTEQDLLESKSFFEPPPGEEDPEELLQVEYHCPEHGCAQRRTEWHHDAAEPAPDCPVHHVKMKPAIE